MSSGAKTHHLLSLMQRYVLPKSKMLDKHRNYSLSTFLMNITSHLPSNLRSYSAQCAYLFITLPPPSALNT